MILLTDVCISYLIYTDPYVPSDYSVLSEFTLALFEDSGWYKANYTALYNLQQNPLQWGKGTTIKSHKRRINLFTYDRLGM